MASATRSVQRRTVQALHRAERSGRRLQITRVARQYVRRAGPRPGSARVRRPRRGSVSMSTRNSTLPGSALHEKFALITSRNRCAVELLRPQDGSWTQLRRYFDRGGRRRLSARQRIYAGSYYDDRASGVRTSRSLSITSCPTNICCRSHALVAPSEVRTRCDVLAAGREVTWPAPGDCWVDGGMVVVSSVFRESIPA